MRFSLAPTVLMGLGLVWGNAIPEAQGAVTDGSTEARGLRWPWYSDDECVSERWCNRIRKIYSMYCKPYPFGFCSTLEWIHDDYCWDTTDPLNSYYGTYSEDDAPRDRDRFFRNLDDLDTTLLRSVDPDTGGRLAKRQVRFFPRECEFDTKLCDKIEKYMDLFCDDPDLYHKQLCKLFSYFEEEHCFW